MGASSSRVGIGAAADILGVSTSTVRELANRGILTFTTTPGGHRRFDPVRLRAEWDAYTDARATPSTEWTQTHRLAGLEEDKVWRSLRTWLDDRLDPLPDSARTILAYAVTETVNNAIDHSRGSEVTISCELDDRNIRVTVQDDGVGVFETIREGFALPSVLDSLVELTKGKRTTAPSRHAGEGLFFTSKAVDLFDLSANGLRFIVDNRIDDIATGSSHATGTVVRLALDADTARRLADVFAAYTDEDLAFVRTTPVVRLTPAEGEFISRSEAKRFAAGLEKFTEVTLDFTGLGLIGQGFADELFRVWHREHPEVTLHVSGASPAVAMMIGRVDPSFLDGRNG